MGRNEKHRRTMCSRGFAQRVYDMCIEISCAGTYTDGTRIEIDNSKCEIFVTES